MLSVIRILQFEYEARGIGATKDRQSGRCRAMTQSASNLVRAGIS